MMSRIWCLVLSLCLFGALSCTVIEEEDFEYEVDPNIGEGNEDVIDSDTTTSSDTDVAIGSDSATETDSGSDTSAN